MSDENVVPNVQLNLYPEDTKKATEAQSPLSKEKNLVASTPFPTKRALSFTEFELNVPKRAKTSPTDTNVRLNVSLNLADRGRKISDRKRLISTGASRVRKVRFDLEKSLKSNEVKNVRRVSACVKAAILNGFINITQTSNMSQVIIQGPLKCGHDCTATLADLLYQPDFVGVDPDLLQGMATVFCEWYKEGYCREGWAFVTGMCKGKPEFDWTGQHLNHCTKCDGIYGECAGDYKSFHCEICGKHSTSTSCCSADSDTAVQGSSQSSEQSIEL